MALPAKYAAFYLPNGSSITFTTEACELVSGTTYKITDIEKRYWDDQQTVTVYENGVESVKSNIIQYPGGRIVFPSAPTTPVTVSGKYYKLEQFGGAYEFDLTLGTRLVDVTQFGDVYENWLALFNMASGRFSRFWFNTDISNKQRVLAVFYLRCPITRVLQPLGDGNFEKFTSGVAANWVAGGNGVYTQQTSAPLVGGSNQRITGDGVGSAALLWRSATGAVAQNRLVRAEIYYQFNNDSAETASATLRSYTSGDAQVESASMFSVSADVTTWTRAYATMKLSDPTSVKIGIDLAAENLALLDVDYACIDVLAAGAAQVRWEGYAYLTDETDTDTVSDAVRQTFSLMSDGQIYQREDEVAL